MDNSAKSATVAPQQGQLWNIKQVRKFFGVSRRTIYRWIKAGKIRKPGGDWRWDTGELIKTVREGPM